MEVENNQSGSSNNKEILLQRPGQESMTFKLADNTGKKSETAKKRLPSKRLRFKKSLGRRNYISSRNKQNLRKNNKDFNNRNRRQRGLGIRRRGVKIIVRGLTRNVTNQDVRYVFEKIGPLKRCGINWSDLGDSKGTADVEYYYRKDAFTAFRKLNYKPIRGVPIRLEMRDGGRKIVPRTSVGRRVGGLKERRSRSFGGARRFRQQRSFGGNNRRRNNSVSGRIDSRRDARRSIRRRLSTRRRGDRKKNYNN